MLPPNELKNKDFARVMRGYSIPEVDEYIGYLLEQYSELYREYDRLEKDKVDLQTDLGELRREEGQVRAALVSAQKAGKQIVGDAELQKAKVLMSCRQECEGIIKDFEEKIAEERRRLALMKTHVNDLKADLFEKYTSHIKYIEELTMGLPEEIADIEAASDEMYTQSVKDMVKEQTEEEYVKETYGTIPDKVTNVEQPEPVYSDPASRSITIPEEDTTPTTEVPTMEPQKDTKVGGITISSVRQSVRSLNGQFEETQADGKDASPSLTGEDTGEFGTEDDFLRFLAEHGGDDPDSTVDQVFGEDEPIK